MESMVFNGKQNTNNAPDTLLPKKFLSSWNFLHISFLHVFNTLHYTVSHTPFVFPEKFTNLMSCNLIILMCPKQQVPNLIFKPIYLDINLWHI